MTSSAEVAEQYNFDKNQAVTDRHRRTLQVMPAAGISWFSTALVSVKITSPTMFGNIEIDELYGRANAFLENALMTLTTLLIDKPGPIRNSSLLALGSNITLLYPGLDLGMEGAKIELFEEIVKEPSFGKMMQMSAMYKTIYYPQRSFQINPKENLRTYLRDLFDDTSHENHLQFCKTLFALLVLGAEKLEITKEEIKLIFPSDKPGLENQIRDLPEARSF